MAEYVTNGTFDTDIIGWTDNSVPAGAIAWDASGYMGLSRGASGSARGDQQLAATVAGVQYALTFDVIAGSDTGGTVEIGTSSGDDSLKNVAIPAVGSYATTFTATGVTTWIGVEFTAPEATMDIDNVSVQEAYGGGYWQSQKGLAQRSDPTLEMGDVEYRELLRAKANANNVDPLLANIYTYIVNAHEDITDCALKDPVIGNLIIDGDMEASGFDAWTQSATGTFTKETTDPATGTQNAKVEWASSNNPWLRQTVLQGGTFYRARGYARANGCSAALMVGTSTAWTTDSSAWVYFDIVAAADGSGTNLWLSASLCNGAGDYHEWDDVTVERVFQAGDVELASNTGVVDIGIDDDELMYQGERNRLQLHGPRSGGSVLNVVNWTYEYLPFVRGLNNTPFWSINDATIDSEPSKILTCDTADFAYLGSHGHFVGTTDDDLAYGTWVWWIYKSAAGAPIVMPIAAVGELPADSDQDGYSVAISAAGALSLNEVSAGAATPIMTTAAATISDVTWTKITLTRSAADAFTAYIDDTAATAATGSNPVTDATTTVSKFMVLDLDAADAVGLEQFEDDIKLFTYEPL